MLSGCFVGAKRGRIVTNGGIAVAGLVLATTPSWHGCSGGDMDERINCDIDTHLLSVLGIALGVGGAAFAAYALSAPDDEQEPVTPPRSAPTEHLRRLTMQAANAGRAGHCSEVRDIASQVAELDADYRDHGFVENMSISLCLR